LQTCTQAPFWQSNPDGQQVPLQQIWPTGQQLPLQQVPLQHPPPQGN
jgi:hypothetical protein